MAILISAPRQLLLLLAVLVTSRTAALQQQQVSLGSLSISPIALGSLNLPKDSQVLKDLLRTSVLSSESRTLIDTAELYRKGKAESVLANAVAELGVERKVAWATKFAPQMGRRDAESVVQACKESCARLGVDSIDLYQIHYSDLTPLVQLGLQQNQDESYWQGLANCYEQGLAKNVGVCNLGPTKIRDAHAALTQRGVPLVSNQIAYTLLRKGYVEETKDVCDELGIQVLSYSPLGKGLLSGKYDPQDESTWLSLGDPERGNLAYAKYRYFDCLKNAELKRVCSRLETIRQEKNDPSLSWASIVYQWHMQQSQPQGIPIVGVKNAAQWRDVQAALGADTLTEAQIHSLTQAAAYSISPTKEFNLL